MDNKHTKGAISPPPLKAGDSVAVLATAGSVKPHSLDGGLHSLQSWGLQVELMPSASGRFGYFSGTDQQRLRDLQQALDNPEIKAVFCARGGYGSSRILDLIDWKRFAENPKWLIGFSDITMLHLKIQQLGIQSLHAPTLNSWSSGDAVNRLKSSLFTAGFPLTMEASNSRGTNISGQALAPMIGGNLCMLAHSIGSDSELDASGKILYLEEVGEPPYRIDRSLTQLQRAGIFENIAGVIVGDMDTHEEAWSDFGLSLEDCLLEKLPRGTIAAFGFPFGHIDRNLALISGAMAHLTVDSSAAKLTFVTHQS